jgi:hypothetical protein
MKKAKLFLIFLLSVASISYAQVSSTGGNFDSLSPKEKLMVIDKISWDRYDQRAFFCKGQSINCFELLHEFNHSLLRDDIERANAEDIRKKYYDALRANGLTFSEAKEKASSVIVDN